MTATQPAEPSPEDLLKDPLLTVTEVTARLRVSRSYIYGLMRNGTIPYIELPRCLNPGKGNAFARRRIKSSTVEKFIEDNQVGA